MRDLWRFGREFASSPRTIGAFAPSSAALARSMLEGIDWSRAGAVVEWGPGTGAFTAGILERLREDARFFAIEVNPKMAASLRRRFPGLRVHEEGAASIERLCRRERLEAVDCVISGLPWASFPASDQRRILDALSGVLRPGGQFVTFAYVQGLLLPAARRFRDLLPDYFSEVRRSPITWANLPPAFVYRCRR